MTRRRKTRLAARRLAAIRRASRQARIGALLVSRVEDVRYLSGFTGDDSFLLTGRGWGVLVTDGRYGEQARRECRDVEVHVRQDSLIGAAVQLARTHKVRRLGVQAEDFTLLAAETLASQLKGGKVVPVRDVLGPLRAVKDAAEVAAVRKAVRVAEAAFRRLVARGRKGLIGRTERDVAGELDYLMRQAGASGPAFETIVAAGAHGSRPHHSSGRVSIRRGQAVLIDWGAQVDGYCSDLTRVVFTGTIPPKLAEIYRVVLRARAEGIGAARPGVMCKSVDIAAREAVCRAGHGEKFLHGLGHGVGLAVHEAPGLSRTSRTRLRAGMIVTVEPGIYLPGVGGIRIEDDILVTRRGRRILSTLPVGLAAMTLK